MPVESRSLETSCSRRSEVIGSTETGAPNLTDKFWIYGGDAQTIATTVRNGRQGHMPTWEGRLSRLDRKILTLYVFDLRGTNP